MQRRYLPIALTIVLSCVAAQTNGATGMMKGGEAGIWDRGACFLIVAHVADVREVVKKEGEREDATHILTLEPICTLAGDFDPSRQKRLDVLLVADPANTSIREAPARGSTILVVIITAGADEDPHVLPLITPDICTFMPEKSALVKVHDLNDKLIAETLKRVRDARAQENAATRPSEPGSGEK